MLFLYFLNSIILLSRVSWFVKLGGGKRKRITRHVHVFQLIPASGEIEMREKEDTTDVKENKDSKYK